MRQIEPDWEQIEKLQTQNAALGGAAIRELARGLIEIKQRIEKRGRPRKASDET